MDSRLTSSLILFFVLVFHSFARAQTPPGSQVKVLALGEKVISIIDDTNYSVLASVPHPAGDVQGWWPAEDGSRVTFVFQTPQKKGFNYRDPARVQVLDLTQHRGIADLPLDIGLDLAASSRDGKIIVMVFEGRKGATSLIAVDAAAGAIAGRRTVTDAPSYLLFPPGSPRVLAVVAGETDEQPEDRVMGRIDLFDLPALEPHGSIFLPGPIAAVFWNADQTLLYALDQGVESKRRERVLPRRVYVIDPAAGAMVANIELGPASVAWDGATIGVLPAPDHGRFYILEEQGIEVLDGKVTEVLGMIPLSREPSGILFLNPSRAYVHHVDSGVISVLDLTNRKVLAEVPTGGKGAKAGKWARLVAAGLLSAGGLAAGASVVPVMVPGKNTLHDTATSGIPAPDGKTVLISNNQTWGVTVVDTATNQVLKEFNGGFPEILADGRTVAAAEARQLSLYDTVEHKILPSFPLAEGGSVCPDGRHIWTGQSLISGSVYRIDIEQRSVEKPLKGTEGNTFFFVVSTPAQQNVPP
jgi:DNA-binding beta-propeller fold protein YncE